MTEVAKIDIAEIVRAAQSGEPMAFEQLVSRTEKLARKVAYPIVGRELVEDTLQEAYLVAFRNLSQLREPGAIIPWLSRIVLHASYRISKKKQTPIPLVKDESSPDQADAVVAKLSLHEALKSLRQDDSEVLLLREMAGLSYQELAYSLRLPVGTVKSRLSKARERLKSALAGGQT